MATSINSGANYYFVGRQLQWRFLLKGYYMNNVYPFTVIKHVMRYNMTLEVLIKVKVLVLCRQKK